MWPFKPKVDNAMDSTQAARYHGKAHVAARVTPVAVGLGRDPDLIYTWFLGPRCLDTHLKLARLTVQPILQDTLVCPNHKQSQTPRNVRYDTIRDAILTCARKPTSVSPYLPHGTDN